MKALLPVLLVLLAVGAGALFLQLDSGRTGRGTRDTTSGDAARSSPNELAAGADAAPAGGRVPAGPETKRSNRLRAETLATPEARGVFEGTVIGEGDPLVGANLALVLGSEVLGEAQTDEHGRFRLEFTPLASAVTLRASARGFVSLERSLTPKPAGGTALLGNLRLARGQRIVGRVVDGSGAGVADAELRVEPTNPGTDVLVAVARSAPDGAFEIADAPPGTVSVLARAKGFGDQNVRYTAGQTPFEIHLEPGAVLSLLLRTPRGRPVVGAEVTIQAPREARGAKHVQRSDERGRVLFEGLAAPGWSVRVAHPEHQPIGRSQMQTGPTEQLLECKPWPAIEGIVKAPGGATPPAGTRVQALPAATPGDRLSQLGSGAVEGGAEVAADGTFRLSGLRTGNWRVRASAPGFAPASSGPVSLGIEGDGYAGTIELQAGARLAFALTLAAQPVAGAELELFQNAPTAAQLWALQKSRGPGLGRRVASGADGRAEFADLLPGTVWVAIYAEGCPPRSSGPHEIGAELAPIAVELTRGARIHGKVVSKAGKPVSGAQLRIVEGAPVEGASADQERLGFPLILVGEPDGRYTSAWLPPGRYTIEAFSSADPTLHSGPAELDLVAGEQRTLDLTL